MSPPSSLPLPGWRPGQGASCLLQVIVVAQCDETLHQSSVLLCKNCDRCAYRCVSISFLFLLQPPLQGYLKVMVSDVQCSNGSLTNSHEVVLISFTNQLCEPKWTLASQSQTTHGVSVEAADREISVYRL